MAESGEAAFERSLGPLGVMFLCFSALSPVVSVYLYGAGIIKIAGTGAVLALILGGALAGLVGLLYGEIGSAFPNAGGVYPAFVRVLGPRIAFPYIAVMLVAAPTTTAFALLGFADYARVLFPALPYIPTALVTGAVAAAIAVLRIRTGAAITGLFLAVEMLALAILTIVCLLHPARSFTGAVLHPLMLQGDALTAPPLTLVALATVAAIYGCGGANWALYFAEEMTDAERRIGRVVTIVSPLAALVIVIPLVAVLLSAPDLKAMLSSDAPIATALSAIGGPVLGAVVSAGVLLAVFNAIVATIMGLGRFLYATARDGLWPRIIGEPLARLSPRLGSPVNATCALALLAAGMMVLGERRLLILSSNQLLLEYSFLALTALAGRRKQCVGIHYRCAAHPLMPILGLLVPIAMAIADWMDPDSGRPGLFVFVVIVVLSLVYRRLRPMPVPALAG